VVSRREFSEPWANSQVMNSRSSPVGDVLIGGRFNRWRPDGRAKGLACLVFRPDTGSRPHANPRLQGIILNKGRRHRESLLDSLIPAVVTKVQLPLTTGIPVPGAGAVLACRMLTKRRMLGTAKNILNLCTPNRTDRLLQSNDLKEVRSRLHPARGNAT
jgi:hypothetical protein